MQDCGGNYYDDIVILLGTGLRVSELYGLTRADIDFDRRCIHVRRQLCRTAEKPYFVTPPKTKSGIRNVPMTDAVYMALMRVVKARTPPKVELLRSQRLPLSGQVRDAEGCDALGELYARSASTI